MNFPEQKRIIFILLFLFMSLLSVINAQNYSLYVGDKQLLVAPNPPTGALYQTAWGTSGAHLKLNIYGSYGAYVTVTDFFNGIEQVQCDYYWRWYDANGRMYTNHATTYYSIQCKQVTITPSPSSMTLSLGQEQQINYSFSPSNVNSRPSVQFISGNTNVVQVSNNGYVRAVGAGSTYITLTNSMGPSVSCSIKVTNDDPMGITLPSTATVYLEMSTTLKPTLTPTGASTSLTWWSDDTKVATVNSVGDVTGVSIGSTKIWVRTAKGGYTASCTVKVEEPYLTLTNTNPQNNAKSVPCGISPSATFSTNLYKGENFNNIILQESQSGINVQGNVAINGKTITFTPNELLESNRNYAFIIPSNALQNKWGTSCPQLSVVNFQTEINAQDIKYLKVWSKDGSVSSFPLDENPKLTFDVTSNQVICKTFLQDIAFSLKDVRKYTLEIENEPITFVKKVEGKKARLENIVNAIVIKGSLPNSNVVVCSLNGIIIENITTDASGVAILNKSSLPNGINIVKVGNISYKIYIK